MDVLDEQTVINATRGWVAEVVIGLNLCPFAHRVADAGRIRYTATGAEDVEELLAALRTELEGLAAAPRSAVETTLLIHPRTLSDFADFNDFLPEADRLVRRLGLRGVIQVVGFHPAYCFAGTPSEAVENYTNRSPYPMLHLLREESVSEVSGDPAALAAISRRNIETLRGLGLAAILTRLHASAGPVGGLSKPGSEFGADPNNELP